MIHSPVLVHGKGHLTNDLNIATPAKPVQQTNNNERQAPNERWNLIHADSMAITTTESMQESDHSGPTDQIEIKSNRKWSVKRFRTLCGSLVNDARVQNFVVGLILLNAIIIGVATFSFVTDSANIANAFDTTDLVFLIIFSVELSFQLVYHGFRLFTDGWLVFDFFIIILSWLPFHLQVVRTFRVFRALRLITRVQVLKNLIAALFSVGPRMAGITALLLLIFYIYGVMCTGLFGSLFVDGETEDDYFGRLDKTFWTLFIMMTLDWSSVSREVMAVYSWAWVVFVSFVMVSSFIVYNLVIAVVCDSVAIIEAQGRDNETENIQLSEQRNLEHVRDLSKRLDSLALEQGLVLETLLIALDKFGVDTAPQRTSLFAGDGDDEEPILPCFDNKHQTTKIVNNETTIMVMEHHE